MIKIFISFLFSSSFVFASTCPDLSGVYECTEPGTDLIKPANYTMHIHSDLNNPATYKFEIDGHDSFNLVANGKIITSSENDSLLGLVETTRQVFCHEGTFFVFDTYKITQDGKVWSDVSILNRRTKTEKGLKINVTSIDQLKETYDIQDRLCPFKSK